MRHDELGKRMHFHLFSVRGADDLDDINLIKEICKAVHMTPVEEPSQWFYPTEKGLGGVGRTTFLPITESFIAIDSWPDHGGRYIVICSCKPIEPSSVFAVVKELGMKIVDGELGHINL